MKHKIKEIRQEKGITQKDLAERLNITRQGVSSIENSDSVTLNTLEKVAKALGCYVHELLDFSGDMGIDSPEDFAAIRDSIAANKEDMRRERIEYARKTLEDLLPKLNREGIFLLLKIAAELCLVPCLLEESEASIIDNGDEEKEEI